MQSAQKVSTAGVPADHPDQLRPVRLAARLSMAVAVTAIVLGLTMPAAVSDQQLLILVLGFAVGLPHGAVDHLVPFWTGWLRRSRSRMVVVLLAYVATAGLVWTGLQWAGQVVLPLLLIASVLHFGAGDLMAEHDDDPAARPASAPAFVVALLARGGPVVAAPLLFWPDQAERALLAVQLTFVMPDWTVRVLIGAIVAGCVVVTAISALRSGRRRTAVEVLLLAALFVVVPPLAAFGVYFGGWHGLRHTARLLVRDPRNDADLAAGRLLRPLRRFGTAAAIPTLIAGGSAAALVLVADHQENLTGTVFTVLLALTVPHLVAVAALDLVALAPTTHRGRRARVRLARRPI